jgi:two-component system cell cycle response regulator
MIRLAQERVLLIGDADRQIQSALSQALPAAQVKCVDSIFDGIAELSHDQFSSVLAAVEPIERRPEAAVRTLRELCGEGRLLLFGHPTLEPLSQKMLEFGCDDYLVTPVTPGELLETLSSGRMRMTQSAPRLVETALPAIPTPLGDIAVEEIVLDALVRCPQDAAAQALRQINAMLAPPMVISSGADAPAATEGLKVITHRPQDEPQPSLEPYPSALHMIVPADQDSAVAAVFLRLVARRLAAAHLLQQRHCGLQRLAITDDLTGLSNGRYFRHFLARVIDKARGMRFPVTLFLFDIDNFKSYNDQYGHGVGDGILKQTAALMRRCVRDHDLVARISGDEFAVVFWEKEGPRQPRDPRLAASGRTPQKPQEMLDRFRRLLSTEDFPGLGSGGKGSLTISGGLAVFPYDAQDASALIQAADKQLMFGAKRSGRNSIHLVGGNPLPLGGAESTDVK